MKIVKTRYIVVIFISFVMMSCTCSQKFNVSEIEQGKWLKYADKSHSTQYFAAFSKDNINKKKYWKILYKDEQNIYFGFVTPKNIFSKKEEVGDYQFYKIAFDDLKKDIPFYETDNLNRLLTDKIYDYEKMPVEITHGRIIMRNDAVQYQILAVYYWHHFEGGTRQTNVLIIMDKDLNVLDMFYLD